MIYQIYVVAALQGDETIYNFFRNSIFSYVNFSVLKQIWLYNSVF
jgi:hypothetical protein